ncbi:probable carbohydrate esterase At4g34215 [Olea europaea var. sylvestris]|uniref:probable carbohydrate esterase At4g34215 n=1 Tax=Olea europaea var. sylvestris TaxID=158386 RepID=UPI000C1CF25A|nr:probable carbohydrate esterase At4g34215 [Olea europaea var. sylvestris]
MIKRAKAIVEVGDGSEIKALRWYQGESDTSKLNNAENSKGRLEKFVQNIRTDLNMPSLLILMVIIESADGPFKYKVIKRQKAFKMPNIVKVDSDGLGFNEDNVHLNTEAEVQLGKWLADAYLNNFA